jgi:type I restriction enzyme, S subunit
MPDIPKIDIRPDHWEIVRSILQKHVPQYAVWAFGSRAKWTAKEYSDLDLAIITDKPLSLDISASLSDDFSESDLSYKVDVVDWATTGESFRKIIERDRVVVQKVELSGAVPSKAEWNEKPLGDVVELKRGYDLPKDKRSPGKVPIISSSGINDCHAESMAQGPGVVTGRYETIGEVFFVDGDYWPLNTTLYVRDFKGNDALFVSYLLRTLDFHAYSDKGAVPGVNRNHLHMAMVRVPDRVTQEAIAKVLNSLDRKIAINRRINQTLEAMAQAIFKSWFVDFEPVKAKIAAKQEGRDPQRAAMSAISGKPDAELDALPPDQYEQLAATAALFPDEMEESELGDIPKGWAPGALSTVCDLNANSWNAKTLPASVKYVDLGNTKNSEVIEIQTVEGANIPSRARRILEAGDTIIGTVRPGNRSFAFVGEAGLSGSTGFAVLRPRKGYLDEYVYLAATADANIERLAHLADGGAYPAVRPELVVSDALPIPSEDLLREFHRISSPMFDQVLAMRRANRGLAALRDTLLPKLLSGELWVADAMVEAEA